jgi:hypothetical protein
MYEDSETRLCWKQVSFSPDQYLVDSLKVMMNWEVLTTDPSSEHVAIRISYHIEWLYKPFGFWRFVESETNKKLLNSAKLVAGWFPERV